MLVGLSSSPYIPLEAPTLIKTFEVGSAVTATENDITSHKEYSGSPEKISKVVMLLVVLWSWKSERRPRTRICVMVVKHDINSAISSPP